MKRIIAGIAILFLQIPFGYCQEAKQPLQFTIKSNKGVYEIGEIIEITYELKNISNDRVLINNIIEPGGNLKFEFVDESGNKTYKPFVLFEYPYWEYPEKKDIIFLMPGESLTEIVEFSSRKYSPSGFTVKAHLEIYTSPTGDGPKLLYELYSNTISIKVIKL